MSKVCANSIRYMLGVIQEKINTTVNAILHHPDFQSLESRWRGVWMLANHADGDKRVIIRLLSVSMKTLSKDLSAAVQYDQSQLYKKVVTEELEQPGGLPFGLVVLDTYISHKPTADCQDTIGFLQQLSDIAASGFSAFVLGASPALLELNSFRELTVPLQCESLFQSKTYTRWQSLRSDERCRHIGLALPRILMREPYNSMGVKKAHRFFEERIRSHEDYCWGNAAYAFATVAIRAFIDSGWFADIRGLSPDGDSGGMVDLIRIPLPEDAMNTFYKPAVEYQLTDAQEKALSDQGLLPLKDNPWLLKGIFYSSQSLHRSKRYTNSAGTVNASLSSQLHYVMCASRFAHYVKVIMRDKIGSFMSANDCEHFLMRWLHQYRATPSETSGESIARYPLSEAAVKVSAASGSPGKYQCTMHLKPHYQLDRIYSQLTLVTQIGG